MTIFLTVAFLINTVLLWVLHAYHMRSYKIHLETTNFPSLRLYFRELFCGCSSLAVAMGPLFYYVVQSGIPLTQVPLSKVSVWTMSLLLIVPNLSNAIFGYLRYKFEKQNYIVARYPLGGGRH